MVKRLRTYRRIGGGALLFATLTLSCEGFAQDARAIYQSNQPSVCSLLVFDSNNEEFSGGSGFLIEDGRKIVTNRHVVEDGATVLVKCGDTSARIHRYVAAPTPEAESDLDLIVLESPIVMGQPLKILPAGNAKPSQMVIGEPVYVIGNPLGLDNSISSGILSGIRVEEGVTYLQVSAPINPGNSGGPLFNERGEVIGVVAKKISGSEGMSFAISVRELETLTRFAHKELSGLAIRPSANESEEEDPDPPPLAFDGSVVEFRGVALGEPCSSVGNMGLSTNAIHYVTRNNWISEIGGRNWKSGKTSEESGDGVVVSSLELAESETTHDVAALAASGRGTFFGRADLFGVEVSVMVRCEGGYLVKAGYRLADESMRERVWRLLPEKYGAATRVSGFVLDRDSVETYAAGGSRVFYWTPQIRDPLFPGSAKTPASYVLYTDSRVSEAAAGRAALKDLLMNANDGGL